MKSNNSILIIIVISQFCCTSLWFAGNGVMDNIISDFHLDEQASGHLTSAVQFGFILGTLLFALFTIVDRFSPSSVFFVCAIIGALFNLGITLQSSHLYSLLAFRFFTGFFLAGIYPVGMKIAADYFEEGLGKSLGYLVGALVIGTAFPHLLKAFFEQHSWRSVLYTTSSLAATGGIAIWLFVPNGPYRKVNKKLDLTVIFKVFRNKSFRTAALGYFGHMWELYTFWAFAPLMLTFYMTLHGHSELNVSFWAFVIIALGGVACVVGAYISQKRGTKNIAFLALTLSCLCCILSPLAFTLDATWAFLSFLIFWGLVVIADSPLFSTLIAQNASLETKGTALTIVNCIGFTITIISIQLINSLKEIADLQYLFLLLALGPALSLVVLYRSSKKV